MGQFQSSLSMHIGGSVLQKDAEITIRVRNVVNQSGQNRTIFTWVSRGNWSYINNTTTRGGEYSKEFYTGRLRPEVQLLTLLYTIFFRKGAPFVYLLLEKGTPLIYLLNSRLFLIPERSFSYPFIYLKSLPFSLWNLWNPYLKPEKGTPFGPSFPI